MPTDLELRRTVGGSRGAAILGGRGRADLSVAMPRRSLHHVRVEGGRHEIDLVVDLGRGRLFAIEFKAGAAPTLADARHLRWLRDELGKQFVGGVVLHSGRSVAELDDRGSPPRPSAPSGRSGSVFSGIHAPRLGRPVGPDGFFADDCGADSPKV